MRTLQRCLGIVALPLLLVGSAGLHAQTTAGVGTVLVIPIVAQTGSYSSEVFVRNPNAVAITVNVKFHEAKQSSQPGLRSCSNLVLAAGQTLPLTVGTQCTLAAGSHFGMLVLEDGASEKINYFAAFARSQTPGGNGFSTEAYPAGNFSGAAAGVQGLKRQASAPIYQTNCFVGALGEAVDYQIQLFNGATGVQIGGNVTGSLLPYEMNRHLDIFAAAGAPAGDYSNARVTINNTNAGEPAFVGFCTVQESTFFGADFRIAKSADALDNRQRRLACYSSDDCATANTVNPTQITDVTRKNIHYFLIAHPDYVKCELVSDRLADLEIQLRGPGDVFLAPVFATAPPYSSGGNNLTSFYIFTGHRNAINGGNATRWYIDASFREGGNTAVPINYGIVCHSGNGISIPWYRASDVDNF